MLETEAPEVQPETIAPEPSEATPVEAAPDEAPAQTVDDLWNADIPSEEPEESPTPSEESPETPSEEIPAPKPVEEPEEAPEPFRMSRKDLRGLEESFVQPFRDPKTPIGDAFKALHSFEPVRASAMAQEIIEQSVESHPDRWMSRLLGEETTVEAVKAKLAQPAPAQTSDAIFQADGVAEAVKILNDTYGDGWRDVANDAELLYEHRNIVPALRQMLDKAETEKSTTSELNEKLSTLQKEVEGFKSEHQAGIQRKEKENYETITQDYRRQVEEPSLNKLLADQSLQVSETDIPEVKAAKEYVQSQFQTYEGFASNFDIFVMKGFSDKDTFAKVIDRVDGKLALAAQKETHAAYERDEAKANGLRTEAQALKADAMREQSSLQVLYTRAASEFLQTNHKVVMDLLASNADKDRRLAQLAGVRPEIIGSSVPANSASYLDVFEEARQQGKNPFELDASEIIQKRVAAG